ncbi:MAG: PfkB family carbohydrate kinase [Caulobacteraceae bacterium]
MSLLAIGLTTLDISARPVNGLPAADTTAIVEEIRLSPAGTAGGMALIAAKLGVETKLASCVGDDAAGRLVRAELEAVGVDTSLLATMPGEPTSTTILPIDAAGQRPNLHAVGAGMKVMTGEALTEAACQAGLIHYGALASRELSGGAGAALLAAAREAGCVITCDLISPGKRSLELLGEVLPYVDFFMPSLSEARFLTGESDPGSAAAMMMRLGAGFCIFKDGANGAWFCGADGVTHIPAHPITPKDTTSCGDAFCAGFMAAQDRDWLDLDSARLGAAAAALVAQGVGTLGALESFEQAEALMREGG